MWWVAKWVVQFSLAIYYSVRFPFSIKTNYSRLNWQVFCCCCFALALPSMWVCCFFSFIFFYRCCSPCSISLFLGFFISSKNIVGDDALTTRQLVIKFHHLFFIPLLLPLFCSMSEWFFMVNYKAICFECAIRVMWDRIIDNEH